MSVGSISLDSTFNSAFFRTCLQFSGAILIKKSRSLFRDTGIENPVIIQPQISQTPFGQLATIIFCIQCTPSLRPRLYLAMEAESASADLLLVLETNGGFPPSPQGLVSARPYSWPAFACCWCCFCFLVASTKDDFFVDFLSFE
jgi:hypothetical protein